MVLQAILSLFFCLAIGSFSDSKVNPNVGKEASLSAKVSIIVAAVFSGIVAFGVVVLVVYFVRKRRISSNSNNGNSGLGCSVTPYAISSPDWINENIHTHRRHGYETLDDDNVPTTIQRPLYINVSADGSLDLPPQLRNIVNEFEQLYENTRYKRLQPKGRRRSVGGEVDGEGNPVYDGLQRETSSTDAFQGNKDSQEVEASANVKMEHKQHHFVDLGELRGISGALQRNKCCMEMTEMKTAERKYRRRFSVDMGQVREFIALREMKISTKEESSAFS